MSPLRWHLRLPLNRGAANRGAAVAIVLLACACASIPALTATPAAAAGPLAIQANAQPRGHAPVPHRAHTACIGGAPLPARHDRDARRHGRYGRGHGRRAKSASCRAHAVNGREGVRGVRSSDVSGTARQAHTRKHARPASIASGQPSIASVLATTCQSTEVAPTPGNLPEVDAATLCLINQERARHNEQPLKLNAQLQAAAQSHSEEMISDDYFGHVSPGGETPLQRILQTGYVPSSEDGYTIGENIAWGTMQLSTPAAIVAAWIASPEHLANILYAPYLDTAVAIVPQAPASLAEGQQGAVYSQEFGVIIAA